MDNISLLDQAKELEHHIGATISSLDVPDLPREQQELLMGLRRHVTDARLDLRDYQYAETRAEQLTAAREGRARLQLVRQAILKASEHNIFGAVDVAQLSASIEQLISHME